MFGRNDLLIHDEPENVKIIIDDARSFINKTNEKYDLIVYGLLDSQMNLS